MSTQGIEIVKGLMTAAVMWENPDRAWFERGDESDVALVMQRTIEQYTGAPAVYDLGCFWLWHKGACSWVSVDERAISGLFQAWSGQAVFASWVEGMEQIEAKTKPLRVNRASGFTGALANWCVSRGYGVGYFEHEARGVSFQDVFLAVLPREGGGLRVEAQDVSHKHRSRASYAWALGEQRETRCDRWLAHLAALWSDDEVRLFGEYLGAAILGVAPHFGRALYLVGARGSGKSTLLEVVRGLMPSDAVSYVSPSDWGDKYKPSALSGSRLNLVYEADDQGALMAQAMIRQVIGGETIYADVKYGQPLAFRPRCAHIFATNGQPIVPGAHAAFWDRFLILTLDKTIRGTAQEVRDYDRILLQERIGIIRWALELVTDALEQGRYTIPSSVAASVEAWRIEADSVATYVDEMCEVIEGWTDTMDLYKDYVRWCEGIGQRPVALRTMAIRLRECAKVGKDPRTRRSQVQLRRKLY